MQWLAAWWCWQCMLRNHSFPQATNYEVARKLRFVQFTVIGIVTEEESYIAAITSF
jgi:hypothetical protein